METYAGSRHFRLQEVAQGVYAAIAVPGTGTLGNAAIVDLGDSTLVVDTFMSVAAASDLRAAAEHLTGRKVAMVFNTHWHGDHTYGNQVFDSAQIISTAKTREIMATLVCERISAHLADLDVIARAVEELEQKMEHEPDDKRKKEIQWEIADDRVYMAALPELKITLPTITFDEKLTIHGSRRSVELITFGGGHTQSDAFLYLPEERVAVMGDLVLSQHHPVMRYANPHNWLRILEQVEVLGVETIVPGHGEAGSLDLLHQVSGYIHDMLALVGECVQSGGDIDNLAIPDAYRGWYFSADFAKNVKVLAELLTKK